MVCQVELDYFQTPRESQIQHAKSELGEDDDRLNHMEKLLESWIATLSYFPKNYDKMMLRNFIRFSKYNFERTKQKLEMYYAMKSLHPDLLCNRNPNSNETASTADAVNVLILPNYTEYGERLFLVRLKDSDVATFDIKATMKLVLMLYDLILTVAYPLSSEILIIDAAGFTPAHSPQFVSPAFRNALSILVKSYTVRLKEIHIVNAPSYLEKVVSMVKNFLPEKTRKRFKIYPTSDALTDRFSEKLLPKEYGGCLKSINDISEDCMQMLKNNSEWFKDQESAIITEDIPKYKDTLGEMKDQLGIQGSFRKITID